MAGRSTFTGQYVVAFNNPNDRAAALLINDQATLLNNMVHCLLI